MRVLVSNEIKKLLARSKSIDIIIFFAALVAFLCLIIYCDTGARNSRASINQLKTDKHNIEVQIDDIKKKEQKNSMDEKLQLLQGNLDKVNAEIKVLNGDWKPSIELDIKDRKEALKKTSGDDKEQIRTGILTDEYLLKKNIQPEDPGKFTATVCIQKLFFILGEIFIIVTIAVFSGDIVSGEFTPPTMKVLITQPVPRGKILMSKFIAAALVSVIFILVTEIISFIIVGLIFRFGNLMYPVIMGTKYKYAAYDYSTGLKNIAAIYGSSYAIPMWRYLIYLFMFEALFITAGTAFAFMISVIFKSSVVSVSAAIVIPVSMLILQSMGFMKKAVPYLLTTYGNFSGAISPAMSTDDYSNMAALYNTIKITPLFSCTVLIAWILICCAISHIIFVKRDVLI